MQIKLTDINLDPSTQSRAAINQEIVNEYAERMKRGAFPPVKLFRDKGQLYIGDGWHRVLGAMQAGAEIIEADVQQGTLKDAIFYSVGSNINHGLRRTGDDKRKAITILIIGWPKMSNRQIADKAGVSRGLVSTVRNETPVQNGQVNIREGADGKTYDVTNIGKKRKRKQRGKSLFEEVRRIVGKAHLEITGERLDWKKDARRISYHVDKITDKAIDSASAIILSIVQDYSDELKEQADKGKIPRAFIPEQLEKHWKSIEDYLKVHDMKRIVDNVKSDMKKKRKQGEMFK